MKPKARTPQKGFNRPANQVAAIQTHAGHRHTGPCASNPRGCATVQNNRVPARPSSMPNNRAASYLVQSPVPLSDRSQQIRATIGGTPQVAGSINMARTGNGRVYISNLQVEQQHRRRGVAAKLIDAAVSAARRQGFSSAQLEARPSDNGISPNALVAMYRRQGFRTVGRSTRGNPLMERKL